MLDQLQKNIHYTFSQVKLLVLALTHSSYCNENPETQGHNERLEFLGDAVLELATSELLYARFPHLREGELTAMRSSLVSQGALARLAFSLGIDGCLFLGRGEEEQGGRRREALVSDAFEAMLGAVFLDGGFAAARQVVEGLFSPLLPVAEKQEKIKDHKSLLQEITQRSFQTRPVYSLLGSSGPEHAKVFEVALELPDGRVYKGSGSSVKRAEQAVAAEALRHLPEKRG